MSTFINVLYIMRAVLITCVILLVIPWKLSGQSLTIFNPQELYDAEGGLYDPSIIQEMHVNFEDQNYHQVLTDAFFLNPSYRIPASVTIDNTVVDSVGVRYKGNSTFCLASESGSPKVPYNLDMNYWIQGQQLMGYKKIKLANAWLDPTYVKELIASQIYRRYLPTPEVSLLALYTQGNYTGLYVNTESINQSFLQKHFDEDSGTLFKCDPASVFCTQNGGPGSDGGIPSLVHLGSDSTNYYDSYDLKSDAGWADLLELTETLQDNPEQLHDILNIDRVLWAFAVNAVTLNLDTYNGYYVHNYYLYRDQEDRFQMIPWDFDNTFVGAIMGWNYWNPNVVYHFDPFFTGDGGGDLRPLVDYLLSIPLFRKQYVAHMRTVMEESMDVAAIEEQIQSVQDEAYEQASLDANSLFGMNFYSENVESAFWADWGFAGILSTINARMDYLQTLPEISAAPPIIGEVTVENGLIQVPVSNVNQVTFMSTPGVNSNIFEGTSMVDDGSNGDLVAGDGTYTTALPIDGNADVKFYIQALNAEAMATAPARAEYEYFLFNSNSGINHWESHTSNWSIAPNPAHDQFILQNADPFAPLKVMDFSGRLLLETNWDGRSISVSDWPDGMYLVLLGHPGNTTAQKLLIRHHR